MVGTNFWRAVAIAASIILILISGFFVIAFLISVMLGLPHSLGFPVIIRAVGGAIVVAGVALAVWLFKYRNPTNMIVSTYITLTKLFGRVPISERLGRTEPLVIRGPQKYVRHPLYLGVITIVFGWGLLTSSTFVLIAFVIILLWFRLVLIPFEERELQALFGDQYSRYMKDTPMLIPFTKRRR